MFEKSTSDARPYTEDDVEEPESHRCVAGKDCRDAKMVDGHRVSAETERPDTLCDRCRTTLGWVLDDITAIWVALHMAIGDQSRRAGQKVGGSRSAPINLNTDIDAAKVAIVEWLTAAAARLAEAMNVDDPRPRNNTDVEQARVITACTNLIAPNLDQLLAMPEDNVTVWLPAEETETPGESVLYVTAEGDRIYRPNTGVVPYRGVDLALKLRAVHRSARKLLLLTTPLDKLSLPCPRCNEYELTRTHRTINLVSGATKEVDQIDCGACGLSWPYQQYQNLCEIWVRKDEMEREKLQQQLDAEKENLQKERERREWAEWLLAKRDWQLSLALSCTDISASEYAATVLATELPDPDELMSDRDVAAAVGVSPGTIRSWASRGHITRHTTEDGSTAFLAGEVCEYARSNTGTRVRRVVTEQAGA